jgi:hypothetical protein
MGFRQVFCLFIVAASLLYAGYVLWHWIRGRSLMSQWVGGAPISRVGQVAFAVFIMSIAASMAADTGWPMLVGIAAWAVGYTAELVDTKRYVRQLEAQRSENASKFPELLIEPPLSYAADELPNQPTFRIFNNVTGDFIGEISREQLQFLIRWQEKHQLGDELKNDFYILEESVDQIAEEGAEPHLTELLRNATAKTHDVFLRWTAFN